MNYARIWAVLDYLDLRPADVFVDVGSGKGRVLCCAARYDMKGVVGVDVSPALCGDATSNVKRMRGRRSPVTVECISAQLFDYSTTTVLFMFNPFGAATLELVLSKLGRDTVGRGVRIAYATPACEAVFEKQQWLERYEYWDDSDDAGLGLSIAFYRSVSRGGVSVEAQ